ncbi:MAG: bifunctional methylenetetrahydrofolate dehydrogenase/methenyltetrahydrofolate cyclohydrolase, partial [Gemmatimonadetes bacterium]|nr:bifunctional methylenetetrahydrofolate dehydrogenase/methenyltetrahydrofolate cyclohydrolase [Gemmatimonadota bacterium]
MAAKIISGKDIAREIRDELNERVAALAGDGLVPGLATVLVGENP